MIRNVVFDIGNVLADYRIKEFLQEKGLDGPAIRRVLKASVMNPYWGRFERGEVSEEETIRAFIEADPGIERELRIAFTDLGGMLTIKDYAIPLVKSLKGAGYRVFYLSNYSKKAYDECGESLAFMPFMDGGLISFRVGMTKPSPEMYRRLLDDYGLRADECVFVDDTPENVEAARAQGFAGIAFSSYEQLVGELAGLGVVIR